MGQAKCRGTFGERKQQAILRNNEKAQAYQRLSSITPLYTAMLLANMFPYSPQDRGGHR